MDTRSAEPGRRGPSFSELRQDVVYGARQLRRHPAFTLAAATTLALGIGATTAVFSLVWAVVLKPLPGIDPERVMAVESIWRGQSGGVSAGNFTDWRQRATHFQRLAAVQQASFNLQDVGTPERVQGDRVSADFFALFRVPPLLGRSFVDEEDAPGRGRAAVLSEGLWRRRFGGDPQVVGRELRLGGEPFTIVGVMPAGFDPLLDRAQLWTPLALSAAQRANHDEHYLQVLGLLRAGGRRGEAQAEMAAISLDLQREYPRDNPERSARVLPLAQALIGQTADQLWVLLGAVVLVLIIACVNVGNLLLSRGTTRSRELAVRAALGAGRLRIVRQLLTESALLAALGAALGLLLATWGVRLLIAASPGDVPRLAEARLDAVVLAFTVVATLGSALLFGLLPALRASKRDVHATLQHGTAAVAGGRDRTRVALVVVEVALASTLLFGAGLLVRSALFLAQVQPGFRPGGLATARLSLPPGRYAEPTQLVATFARVVEALQGMPGVEVAAVVTQAPMGAGESSNGLIPEGKALEPENRINSLLRVTTEGYLRAAGLQLLRGRFLSVEDVAGAERVMVISRSLARAAFPGQDPLGKRILCCEGSPTDPRWKTVVGVVEDVRADGPAGVVTPEFYLPLAQAPADSWRWNQQAMTVVARGRAGDAAALLPVLRAAVSEVDASVPLYDLATMDERLHASTALYRFLLRLLGALGVSGLGLAAVGVYGVVAFGVAQRRREIGLRMALGATRGDVLGMTARNGLAPVVAGLVVGGILSVGLGRSLASVVRGVGTADPVTLAAVAGCLALSSIAAVLLPARRAAAVQPAEALSAE